MDDAALRSLVHELAEKFGWLEAHARRHGHPEQAADLHLASGLVRNVVGLFLDGQPTVPLHVAVVGGAGAGKSTVVNFLCGTTAAEANPQAGFTRHPVAYLRASGFSRWPAQAGFLAPLRLLDTPAPSNLDENVYQIRKLSLDARDDEFLGQFAVWDCPDMTSWASEHYVARLFEIASLADVIVYVASDERYNDALPTRFLRMLLQAGKPVVACLTKVHAEHADSVLDHFRTEVLQSAGTGRVATVSIPYLSKADLEPSRATAHRIPLLNQVMVLGDPAGECRARSVRTALHSLDHCRDHFLSVARNDTRSSEDWRHLVQQGETDFLLRYRQEFLTSEKFRRFDESLVRLIDLLELPGVGKFISGTLYVVRTPYRLIKGLFRKAFQTPDVPSIPEKKVLETALAAWLDQLRAEALRRSAEHPLWQHIADKFDREIEPEAREQFEAGVRTLQADLNNEVDRTARAIYEELERSPAKLNALRSGKLALDVAAISSALVIGHIGLHDLILVPASAAVSQSLVEWMGAAYVENEREKTRQRQKQLVADHLATPLARWFENWPVSGGSDFERTHRAIRDLPSLLQRLHQAVQDRFAGGAT